MRLSRLMRSFSVIACLALILSLSGAYAAWQYAEAPLYPASVMMTLDMDIFHWEGSDILPDDEETGHAHAKLIDMIINGETIGLNAEDSYLNEQIKNRERYWNRDTLGSMAITQGDALHNLFDLDTENTSFLIQMVSDDKYYVFTTSVELGEKGSPTHSIDSTISPIYRTTVEKQNGVWVATGTEEGNAKSAYYEESQLIFITRSKIPSFDPDSWKAN